MNLQFRLLLGMTLLSLASGTARAQQAPSGTDSSRSVGIPERVCSCIDSISSSQAKDVITDQIHACINKYVIAYQLTDKLYNNLLQEMKGERRRKKSNQIVIATDENSKIYKDSYNALEQEMLQNCPRLKVLLASNDAGTGSQLSLSPVANDWYTKGLKATEQEDYKTAATCYRKAVETDPKFIYAWDNLGLAYRNLEQYSKAIDAYEHSLAINPRGTTPLQNAAVASFSNKDYEGAIKYYKRLAEVDADNPEVYYGLGQVYAVYLEDYENALPNICTAYRLYIAQKSPYRADAEKIISVIYKAMKASGKEARFREILKEENMRFGKD